MPSPHVPDRTDGFAAFAPVFLANLLPLAGVVWLSWDPTTLAVVYGLEVLLSIPVAGGKALFAQRPPRDERDGVLSVGDSALLRKRGGFRPVAVLPPVYPRNLPFVGTLLSAFALYALVFGVLASESIRVVATLSDPNVLTSVAGLFVGQLVETWREYVRDGDYERASPYEVVETPVRRAFFLLFVLFAVAGTGVRVVLVAVVVVKLLVEWSVFRAERADGSGNRFTEWLAGPDDADPPADPEFPASPPTERARPSRTAILVDGVAHAVLRAAPWYLVGALVVWIAVIGVVGDAAETGTGGQVTLFVLGFLIVVALAVKVGSYYLAHGTVEYQRRGDHLVAYDALLDEVQWATPLAAVRNVSVANDRLTDRFLGTRTIRVSAGWDDAPDRDLGPFADPTRVAAAFDLSLAATDLDPIRRSVALGAVALPAGLAVGVGALWAPVVAVFLLPFFSAMARDLLQRACSDSE